MPNGHERERGIRLGIIEQREREVERRGGIGREWTGDIREAGRELEQWCQLWWSISGFEQLCAEQFGFNGIDEHDDLGVECGSGRPEWTKPNWKQRGSGNGLGVLEQRERQGRVGPGRRC